MATVRCYVPLSPQQVDELRTRRHLDGPLDAYAVTGAIRASRSGGDDEEWEYAALQEAAASLARQGLPVLVAAVDLVTEKVDLLDGAPSTGGEEGRARVTDLDLPRAAAFHLGDDLITGEVPAMAAGELIELSWYDTTEISHVAELARAGATPG